ncbi:MAG: glycosyltransferase, partial [Planctomycetaceae bacterium]
MNSDDTRSRDDWPPGRVLVQTATYKERENVGPLLDALRAAVPEAQLLVIDDDSPDGTAAIALEKAAADPAVHVLVRRGRRGLGSAILEGMRLARARGFDVAVYMDADFRHDPADVPALLAALAPVAGRPAGDRLERGPEPGHVGRSVAVVGVQVDRHVEAPRPGQPQPLEDRGRAVGRVVVDHEQLRLRHGRPQRVEQRADV